MPRNASTFADDMTSILDDIETRATLALIARRLRDDALIVSAHNLILSRELDAIAETIAQEAATIGVGLRRKFRAAVAP